MQAVTRIDCLNSGPFVRMRSVEDVHPTQNTWTQAYRELHGHRPSVKPAMDESILLNVELDQINQGEVKCWCATNGMRYSTSARLAHRFLQRPSFRASIAASLLQEGLGPLPPKASPEDPRWQQLRAWTLPGTTLNLLQLAVLTGHKLAAGYLWTRAFTHPSLYRDASSRVVNYPLHLAVLWEHIHAVPSLSEEGNEAYVGEGLVDLNAAVEKSSATASSTVDLFRRSASSSYPDTDRLLQMFSVQVSRPVTGTPLQFAVRDFRPRLPGQLLGLAMADLCVGTGRVQARAVERLWGFLHELNTYALQSLSFAFLCVSFSLHLRGPYLHDKLLVFCHILLGHCNKMAEDSSHPSQCALLCDTLRFVYGDCRHLASQVITSKIVSFLPRKMLWPACKHFQKVARCRCPSVSLTLAAWQDEMALALHTEARERTLERTAVLKVLEYAKGDGRRFQNNAMVPGGLRKRLQLPFQELYDELKEPSGACP